jgi:hypothetical protein
MLPHFPGGLQIVVVIVTTTTAATAAAATAIPPILVLGVWRSVTYVTK